MRNRIIAGLFTTAVLIFAAPVAATEIDNILHSSRIEEIQGMIQRSRERQGSVQTQAPAQSQAPAQAQAPAQSQAPAQVQAPAQAPAQAQVPAQAPAQAQTSAQAQAPAKGSIPATVVPQRAQQVAVRHANRHRHQSASDEPPATKQEPSREVQVSHKPFMLFAADLAWNRVDESSDKSIRNPYSLGARLENGVITPLAAIRVYAPDKLPEALAILAGEKEYT